MSRARLAKRTIRSAWVWILVVILLPVALIAGSSGIRGLILRTAGWALVASDPLEPADIIVIAVDAGHAGVLEAADLVHEGIAGRVAVFVTSLDVVDREFIRRGLPDITWAARSARQLAALGVTAVEQIPRVVEGTESEGEILPGWCAQHRFRSVVVVSGPDHSRRLRRVLQRAMKGQSARVMVRPARYSAFDPDHWWQTRAGIRTELIELQKLLLDVTRHPFS